jgi:hypothetical protein
VLLSWLKAAGGPLLQPLLPFAITGVTWKAQNQAAVLLASGQKGHRYSFPHAKISTAPPIMNRVFGQAVDAQLQANELEYATKYYAAILARSTGKDLETCQKEYLARCVPGGVGLHLVVGWQPACLSELSICLSVCLSDCLSVCLTD